MKKSIGINDAVIKTVVKMIGVSLQNRNHEINRIAKANESILTKQSAVRYKKSLKILVMALTPKYKAKARFFARRFQNAFPVYASHINEFAINRRKAENAEKKLKKLDSILVKQYNTQRNSTEWMDVAEKYSKKCAAGIAKKLHVSTAVAGTIVRVIGNYLQRGASMAALKEKVIALVQHNERR